MKNDPGEVAKEYAKENWRWNDDDTAEKSLENAVLFGIEFGRSAKPGPKWVKAVDRLPEPKKYLPLRETNPDGSKTYYKGYLMEKVSFTNEDLFSGIYRFHHVANLEWLEDEPSITISNT